MISLYKPHIASPFSLLPFASMRVLLHSLTHFCHTALASPYAGASSLHRNQEPPLPLKSDRVIFCYICIGVMAPSMYTLWLVVWSLGALGGPVSWYCSSYGVAISFSSFSPSPSSSIGVLRLSLMVGCEYLHLYWSGVGRTSQGTAIPGSCQQVLLGISNSVGVWCLQMGWIPGWGGLWMAFGKQIKWLIKKIEKIH